MRRRLPLVLSTTALVVAVLGSTPLGEAAGTAINAVPPLAKKANFAARAGTADNARKLGGKPASAYARLGANGKIPPALLAASARGGQGIKGDPGPKGDKGDKGEKGEKGDRGPGGLVAAFSTTAGTNSFTPLTTGSNKLVTLSLPAGRYFILAQATIARDVNGQGAQLFGGCRLIAGDEKATAVVAGAKAPSATYAIASTALIHEFTAPGVAELNCNDATFGQSSWSEARINAIQVAPTQKITTPGGNTAGGGVARG